MDKEHEVAVFDEPPKPGNYEWPFKCKLPETAQPSLLWMDQRNLTVAECRYEITA